MPVYFSFTADDPVVKNKKRGLSGTEILAVTRWQTTELDYHFSFHELHTAGHPVYVCKSSDHGQRKMTKADVNGKTVDQVGFVNGEKLEKKQLDDAKAVIAENLAAFQKLAKNYYEGVDDIQAPKNVTEILCKQCKKSLTGVKPTKGKLVCPHCSKWN